MYKVFLVYLWLYYYCCEIKQNNELCRDFNALYIWPLRFANSMTNFTILFCEMSFDLSVKTDMLSQWSNLVKFYLFPSVNSNFQLN